MSAGRPRAVPRGRGRRALQVGGLLFAGAVLVVASQLLLHGFESEPLIGASTVADVVERLQRPLTAGAAVLAGVALIALALVLGWFLLRSFGPDRPVITTRRRHGATRIDRTTLAAAIARRLEAVDRRNDVEVTVDRRGRVDLSVVGPDPSATGVARELRDSLRALCEERGLPCRAGRIRITTPRRWSARRRVR